MYILRGNTKSLDATSYNSNIRIIHGVSLFFNLISITQFNLLNSRSNTDSIPTAEIVHSSESMKIPTSFGTFVILIPNESHQDWSDEKYKLITDKN
jgi:hypothetical protein